MRRSVDVPPALSGITRARNVFHAMAMKVAVFGIGTLGYWTADDALAERRRRITRELRREAGKLERARRGREITTKNGGYMRRLSGSTSLWVSRVLVLSGFIMILASAVSFAQQPDASAEAMTASSDAGTQQTEPAPSKRLTVTTGIDFASAYMFRGIYQEDKGVIVPPYVDLGMAIYEGNGALSSVSANVGLWNSLHSGPSGAQNPTRSAWYESDLYASVTLGFGSWKPGALYTAYTSPNDAFVTVHELALSVAYDDSASAFPLAPKALVAFELDGQADGGANKGTYLELGVRPSVKLIDAKYPLNLAIPAKVGLSLRDYYEGAFGSNRFGYADLGFIAGVPFASKIGAFELHGGVDFLFLGDNPEALNGGDSIKPVGTVGLSFSY
jgi:hypothetical protein